MEPDIATSMVRQLIEQGHKLNTLIMDDDATTISRIHNEVDPDVKKVSDSNHSMKLYGKQLYDLAPKHKTLSVKVIQYLQKNFTYAISQTKGKPDELKERLESIVPHAFGKHDKCTTWCKKKTDPSLPYKDLPRQKPLSGEELEKALTNVMKIHINKSEVLSNLGSSQCNESFNNTIASKVNKAKHLSSSGTLTHKIDACVAQKNIGPSYFEEVNVIPYFKC